ncbi:hypothetical protein GW17_00047133 [Ensete ventricosum]|nr:hypothetical protein GW17_00047133 [Ensete ventricosum]
MNKVDQNNGRNVNMSWVDCLSNMSFGAILSEVSETPVNLCHPLPAPNSSLQQIPITCDSFDAAVASVMARHQPSNPSNRLIHSSILEAEETCHAFPFAKVASSSHNHPASTRDPLATQNGSDVVLSDFSGLNLFPDSLGPLESIAPCSREMNDGETVGLGGLITSSMDAFQNFSIF